MVGALVDAVGAIVVGAPVDAVGAIVGMSQQVLAIHPPAGHAVLVAFCVIVLVHP